MASDIGEREFEFLSLLFRKSKSQVIYRLKKSKDATRSSSFNHLQEVIFDNCNALVREASSTSCFCLTKSNNDIEYLECITELVRSGSLRFLFKMCEAKIEQLPDPSKQPNEFVDGFFDVFFCCTQISSGQFSLNPNSGKNFTHTNELTVNSTSSSSAPSDEKYNGDDSESDKSPTCRTIVPTQAAKTVKRMRKRAPNTLPSKSSNLAINKQQVVRVPNIKPKVDDQAYLADVESIGSGPLKTSTELDKWAAIYRMLKEDFREEFAEKKEIRVPPSATARVAIQQKSILKPASQKEVQKIEPRTRPARLKSSLAPVRPLSQHSQTFENLPKELLINLKQIPGQKSRPVSVKSEQIKLVLARKQELDKSRINNLELARQRKETRLSEVKGNKHSVDLERKTKGQLTRQERVEMAKSKRQFILEQQNKTFQKKGIFKSM